MRIRALVLLIGCFCFATVANATDIWWGNPNQSPTGGNGDWGTANNWGGLKVPGAADNADINYNGSPYPTLSSGAYDVSSVLMGYWGAGGMSMTGGSIGVSNLFAVGYEGGNWNGPATNATFTMNDGLIGDLSNSNNDAAQLWIGYSNFANYKTNGTMTMNGGRVDVRWAMNVGGGNGTSTVGQLNLAGGQINLWEVLNVAQGSNINLSGGTLALWDKWSYDSLATIQQMISDGRITGNGIVGNVQITTFANGQTDGSVGIALTAAPEPATMVLLGLGGIAFIRRK